MDVAEAVAAVSGPGVGGVNVFVGAVRDHDDGHGGAPGAVRGVTALSYEAHPSALDVLREVAQEVADEFGVDVAAVHRVGDLAVGDVTVVVAAGAGHRGPAYDASRALIDRLKQRVPIWKNQHFDDGTSAWVGSP